MSWRGQKNAIKNNYQVLGIPCYALREIIRHTLENYLMNMACVVFSTFKDTKKEINITRHAPFL